ncbi:MAG: hypothetical protein AVDCRST_MAG93-3900, partial [uncultured Chloroflexia bacterium]
AGTGIEMAARGGDLREARFRRRRTQRGGQNAPQPPAARALPLGV